MTDDNAPPVPLCFACTIHRPAQVRYRVVPRRDVEPFNDAIRRALAWPGQADPIWIHSCGSKKCHDVVRSIAVSVLAAEALDAESVVQRTVS